MKRLLPLLILVAAAIYFREDAARLLHGIGIETCAWLHVFGVC